MSGSENTFELLILCLLSSANNMASPTQVRLGVIHAVESDDRLVRYSL